MCQFKPNVMKTLLIIIIVAAINIGSIAQTVTVQIDALTGRKPISPYIYGKNNCLSDIAGEALSAAEWQYLRDAGVKMFRECGGNNATKYNWRLKLSSHPDWYNNVYSHDWNFAAKSMLDNMPGTSGMWAFQLIGKAASNKNNNFNDWDYNNSSWWSGVAQNLAGGGTVNPAGGENAIKDGNPDLYLMNWPADSTVGILDHWFGAKGLGYNKDAIRYWGMDNEVEIWNGTHDDIMPTQLSAENFMQKYFDVAKKAREKFPEIKLMGPVPCNEWQWYNWNDNVITSGGKNYSWLEFFIKRIAEEQQSSGVRLLDVLDIHFYPSETNTSDIVQLHRAFFDTTYNYPGANGVKNVNGSWNSNITKEYIFHRCRKWLEQYIGANHGVTFSVSEMGINGSNANVTAVWYASTLGTFANEGVEIFTPWTWKTGMWETLHLFSRYSKGTRVASTSNLENYVSAYSSVSSDADSLTVILVNRSASQTQTTTVNLSNFTTGNGAYNTLTLSNLSGSETFKSHTNNALKAGTVNVSNSAFTLSLAPLSITAVLLSGTALPTNIMTFDEKNTLELENNLSGSIKILYKLDKASSFRLELYDLKGRKITTIEEGNKSSGSYENLFDGSHLANGFYILRLQAGTQVTQKKVILLK
jgi:hypothetical protein